MKQLTVTSQAEATILAALGLAAMQYADPSPCYAAKVDRKRRAMPGG